MAASDVLELQQTRRLSKHLDIKHALDTKCWLALQCSYRAGLNQNGHPGAVAEVGQVVANGRCSLLNLICL